LIGGGVTVAVVVVIAVLVMLFLNQPPSPLFTVTGKQQPMETIHSDYLQNGYDVINWNFTFVYNGENPLQNVNLYLNNGNMPFMSVLEVAKGWTYEYIWTSGDTTANATITISWQGGTEHYEFQP
jgi:hypothetical protein